MFVDNATDHIKIVFDDHFTTALNSEGAIDPDKWKSIAQCKSAWEWSDFDDKTNCDLADEWLTPDEVLDQSQQQCQDAVQCPTWTDPDPNHFW